MSVITKNVGRIEWTGKGLYADDGSIPATSLTAQYAKNYPAPTPEDLESRLKNTIGEKIASAIEILNRGYKERE